MTTFRKAVMPHPTKSCGNHFPKEIYFNGTASRAHESKARCTELAEGAKGKVAEVLEERRQRHRSTVSDAVNVLEKGPKLKLHPVETANTWERTKSALSATNPLNHTQRLEFVI